MVILFKPSPPLSFPLLSCCLHFARFQRKSVDEYGEDCLWALLERSVNFQCSWAVKMAEGDQMEGTQSNGEPVKVRDKANKLYTFETGA